MAVANSALYPTVETVMNLARVFVNDSYNNGAGRVLTDTAAFTLPLINQAIARVQFTLANNGVQSFWRDNVILEPITAVQAVSSSTQIYVSNAGYFDGTTMFDAPVLPNDLLVPWDIWQAPLAGGAWVKMTQPDVALEPRSQNQYLGQWEWRGSAIFMNGATQDMKFRLRYEAVIPFIESGADFSTTTIPMAMSAEALAYRIAFTYSQARGDNPNVAALEMQADKAVDKLVEVEIRRKQRQSIRRRGFRHRRSTGRFFGMIG